MESVVKERYALGAEKKQESLCCPVDYNKKYLEVIPTEVIEKDYGCGDPSKYLKEGETVLDLGSGTGKICFIASQIVGEKGKVIGVDMTDDMLEVAKRNSPIVADKIGYNNVEFVKGRIQDLALDIDLLENKLKTEPIVDGHSFMAAQEIAENLRVTNPLISNNSVDVVVSNCVLNLVSSSQKNELFKEIFRVLKKGGRAVISDIVSDEEVPFHLQNDNDLWSGCISGALTEEGFIQSFLNVGFYGVQYLKYETKPWQTVEGIEFRSVTIEAFKGKEGECLELNQAVIYKGPFSKVYDDDGHFYCRGERIAVCEKTYNIFKNLPYKEQFLFVDPISEIKPEKANKYDSTRSIYRHPKETKGIDYRKNIESDNLCCDPEQEKSD